jgi:hypothetical protein
MRYNDGIQGMGVYSANAVTFGTWPATFPARAITNSVFSIYGTFAP